MVDTTIWFKRSVSLILLGGVMALSACGDTAPKWEPQDMMAGPAQNSAIPDAYRKMVDFKALAKDDAGHFYAAGPKATIHDAALEAVVKCQMGKGENCHPIRLGLTSIEGLSEEQVTDVVKSYRDTMLAEANQAANNGNIQAANWLAFHYATRNVNLDEAERLIKLAMKVQPNNASILDTYGFILYRKGDFKEAEQVLIKVNRAAPIAEHIAHFADNALAMGKTDMARAAYQRALQANPDPVLSQQIQKRLLTLDMQAGGQSMSEDNGQAGNSNNRSGAIGQ